MIFPGTELILIYNLTERMYVLKFKNDGDDMSKKIKIELHKNKNSRIQ